MKVPNCPLCGFNPHWIFAKHKSFKNKGYYICPDCGMRVGTFPAIEQMTNEEIVKLQQVIPRVGTGSCRTRVVYVPNERDMRSISDPTPGDVCIVAANHLGLSKMYYYMGASGWVLMNQSDGLEDQVEEYATKLRVDSLLNL